jgi:hypothetical protein
MARRLIVYIQYFGQGYSTKLENVGAAYGPGIYAAHESDHAAEYAYDVCNSTLDPARNLVLFVCELVEREQYIAKDEYGEETGIHCVTDPEDIIVRALVTADKKANCKGIDSIALQAYLKYTKDM